VDLNLIDLQSNQIVWPGEKQIKKIIERPGVGF
jgi:PBP1b-binding outer membrane lipoprotein LpoB